MPLALSIDLGSGNDAASASVAVFALLRTDVVCRRNIAAKAIKKSTDFWPLASASAASRTSKCACTSGPMAAAAAAASASRSSIFPDEA